VISVQNAQLNATTLPIDRGAHHTEPAVLTQPCSCWDMHGQQPKAQSTNTTTVASPASRVLINSCKGASAATAAILLQSLYDQHAPSRWRTLGGQVVNEEHHLYRSRTSESRRNLDVGAAGPDLVRLFTVPSELKHVRPWLEVARNLLCACKCSAAQGSVVGELAEHAQCQTVDEVALGACCTSAKFVHRSRCIIALRGMCTHQVGLCACAGYTTLT
jgi:hypothetical protein